MATRVSSPTIVGREGERGILIDAIARATAGSAAALLIDGEAGIGKTRLVSELGRLAADAGAMVGVGSCVPLGDGGSPYLPVSSAMTALLARMDDAALRTTIGSLGGELVRLVPGLPDRIPDLAPASETAWARTSMFEAIMATLDALADHAPVVLVFEDLHWADAASLELIAYLLQSPRRRRSLVAITYRNDELAKGHALVPWLAEVGRLPSIERISLEPMERTSVDALLCAIAGAPPGPEQRLAIWRRSGGNPFFVEELLAATDAVGGDRLPVSLREVLLGRLATLDVGPRSVLEAVAIAEGPVMPELLADVLAASNLEVDTWSRVAIVAHHLVVTDPQSGALDVRHALVREALVDELLPGQRRRLHRAFAAALERSPERDPARVAGWWAARAHHAIAAGDLVAGLTASVAAGRAAFDAAAFEAARAHLERAVELLDGSAGLADALIEDDRASLLSLAADASDFLADDAVTERLRRAAVNALGTDAPVERRAQALLDLATIEGWDAWDDAGYDRALALTSEAYELLRDRPATVLRARAEATLARELGGAERWEASLEVAERAAETAAVTGDPSVIALARIRVARALAAIGRQADAEDVVEGALAVARRAPDRSVVGLVYALGARVHEGGGDAIGAARIHDEAATIVAALGIRVMDIEIVRAWNHFQIGDWTTTFAILDEHEHRGPPYDVRFHLLGALASANAGRFTQAMEHLRAITVAEPTTLACVRADAALWMDRARDAATAARDGLAAPPVPYALETWQGRLNRYLARAEADIAVGARRRRRHAEAAAAADRAAAAAQALDELITGQPSYRDRFGGELPGSRALAHAEAARASEAADPGRWATAVSEWETLGRPAEVAYARWRLAEALLASGGPRDEARLHLDGAAAIAGQLGAAPILSAVEATSRRARIRLGSTDAVGDAGVPVGIGSRLTPREREVLALLCRGASNRQIATELFISENTAGVHVSNIIGKLEVGSRTEAVAVAHLAGLADPTSPGTGRYDSV